MNSLNSMNSDENNKDNSYLCYVPHYRVLRI